MKLLASDKIYITKSKIPGAGRGVFAKSEIKKGEVVEKCPIIEVPKNDLSILEESHLVTYFFYFGKKKERIALALGFGSIYNHSLKPNLTYKVKPKQRIIEFRALENIKKNEELTFNYYNSTKLKDKKRPLWFEV